MFRLVNLYASAFNVFFQQIVYTYKFDALISEPILQTKPGRKVGVASLRQEEILTFEGLIVLHNSPDDFFHGIIISGEESPVDPFPVL